MWRNPLLALRSGVCEHSISGQACRRRCKSCRRSWPHSSSASTKCSRLGREQLSGNERRSNTPKHVVPAAGQRSLCPVDVPGTDTQVQLQPKVSATLCWLATPYCPVAHQFVGVHLLQPLADSTQSRSDLQPKCCLDVSLSSHHVFSSGRLCRVWAAKLSRSGCYITAHVLWCLSMRMLSYVWCVTDRCLSALMASLKLPHEASLALTCCYFHKKHSMQGLHDVVGPRPSSEQKLHGRNERPLPPPVTAPLHNTDCSGQCNRLRSSTIRDSSSTDVSGPMAVATRSIPSRFRSRNCAKRRL